MKPEFNSPNGTETLKYLLHHKVQLFGIPFCVAVVIAIITLFIPNKYSSTANLLPSQRPSFGLDLFSEDGGLQSIASSVLSGETEESNRYIILLSSFSTSQKVIKRFDLMDQYESELMIDAVEELSDRTTFESMEEGNFLITVEDEDSVQARDMAEYYVEILNELNTEIVSKDARLYREFIEKRYLKSVEDISRLKNETISFQKEYGVFQLPEQAKEYFSIISALTVKELETEVKLALLEETVQKESPSYQAAQSELSAINQKLADVYNDTSNTNLLLNFGNLSEVGARYFELNLEKEIQTEIQKFLLPLYEQAKMEEAKSLPIVSIVDAPRVPEEKSSPKRSLIVISAGITAFILVLIYFILRLSIKTNREYLQYLKSE